jgi:drug/metabolite transporter (DMT)-like permease
MPYLLLILTTLFWSGNFVVSRGMHATIPPLALSFWRWMLALLILLCFCTGHLLKNKEKLFAHKGFLFTQGVLGVAGFNSLVYLAMQTTTAINAVLVNSCIPVIIVFFSQLMYKDRLTARQWLGVVISFTGVLFIVSHGHPAALISLTFNQGDILVFLAAICWAFYSANLKRYPPGLHPLAYLTAIVIIGLGILLPMYLLELAFGKTMAFTAATAISVIYVALFASVLAFIFWNRAVSMLGANIAGPFIHLMPVFSTILAYIFLDEKLTRTHLIAICLIFSGIFLTTVKIKKVAR